MRKFNITVDGRMYEVEVEEVGTVETASAPVVSAPVAKAAAPVAKAAPAPKKAVVSGGTKLEAPMPGMVVSFKVSDGDVVKKGQPVVVLEAMKMENDITAPCDGTFKAVATKGSNVNTGDVLAVIS
ncbi:MAG: acetyl-CoA carboxylase biotin carboxyl carrier protein subunit [Clostridia bacterium]|nr:acetyl-CoA carboxylase biotin carboxyl carrier protein subunit [Clostridia bacterium]MBR2875245.1 acetyl-CoA carboxylase biotin carboxyl carrier protein subunit [Clostridia bacterium]